MALAKPVSHIRLLKQGVAAAKAGDKPLAHRLLVESAHHDPQTELTWLWLASVASSPAEAIQYLEQALLINPTNPRSAAWLRMARKRLQNESTQQPEENKSLGRESRNADNTSAIDASTQRTTSPWRCPSCGQSFIVKPDQCICRVPLPAARVRATVVSQERTETTTPASQPTVLVVDDSPTIRRVVSVTLEQHGYRVLSVGGGVEALALLQDTTPEMILLDVTMPHLDGYSVCHIIKNNRATQDIPVVFFSGKSNLIDRVRGRMKGGIKYLSKPVHPATLVQVVEETCGKSTRRRVRNVR